MKQSFRFLPACLLVLLILGQAGSIQAQRLYDEGRDKQAQEAAKLAEEVSNNSTFEKQLKNLDAISQRDSEVYFRGAKRQMELDVSGFRTWVRVKAVVDRVERTLDTEDMITAAESGSITHDLTLDCSARTSRLGKAICTATEKLAALKKAVSDSEQTGKDLEEELKSRLEKIGEIETLVNKAETYLKSGSKNNDTIKGLSEVFINLSNAYVNYTNKLAVINNHPNDDLKLILQRVAVETLQLEVDHWNAVSEIKLRRVEEQQELRSMVKEFNARLEKIASFYGCFDAGTRDLTMDARMALLLRERTDVTFAIVMGMSSDCTVDDQPRDKVALITYLFQTLHVATALAARGETPMKLAELRLAQEQHRFSIRQSAVVSRSYEVVINSGTKRLARYYAGGLKPEAIAQMIYSAATVAIPAVIAGK